MTDEEMAVLREDFLRDLKALEQERVGYPFIWTAAEVYFVLYALQLALRHPAMRPGAPDSPVSGLMADWMRALATDIEDRLCTTPALRKIAEMGWGRNVNKEDSAYPV